MAFVIGVDGGGTTTKCACVAHDGTLLSTGEAGPSNYQRIGLEEALGNIRQAAQRATESANVKLPAAMACFCLAGIARPSDRAVVIPRLEELGIGAEIIAEIDAEAALAGAHALRPGVVVSAGTGAIAYGRNADGQRARVDGWGPLLGDEGSAYWIGIGVLRAVMRAYDGRGAPTKLTAAVLEHFGVQSETELIPRLPLDRTNTEQIAQLAPICARVEQGGDRIARKLLQDAGKNLAKAGLSVVRTLGLDPSPRLALMGGVLSNDVVRTAFEQALQQEMPGAQAVAPEFPAVLGAALMALELLGVEVDSTLLAKLSQTEAS